MNLRSALTLSAICMAAVSTAQAEDTTSNWIWRVGLHSIQPKSDNHEVVEVDSAEMLTFGGTYLFAKNWGVEVLAALPFKHDISLRDGAKVAETEHLPPTVSLQYHFNPDGNIRPYVGAGLNYTVFFNEETTGALDGVDLELDPSFGPAAQVGVDIALNTDWFINVDARWFDIDTDASANGADLGTVEIDPYAFGVSVGRRF